MTVVENLEKYKVENEPGCGQFLIDFSEGDSPKQTTPVIPLCIDIVEFTKKQLAAGKPIAALRFSGRGSGGFLVNPEVLTVEEMISYYPDNTIMGCRLVKEPLMPSQFYEKQFIHPWAPSDVDGNPLPGYLLISGHTRASLPFRAKVYFQPSPK